MVDYYARLVSNTEIDDFGNSLADGFLFTADFIGEYIKDCIIAQHSANDGSLRLDFPQKYVIVRTQRMSLGILILFSCVPRSPYFATVLYGTDTNGIKRKSR